MPFLYQTSFRERIFYEKDVLYGSGIFYWTGHAFSFITAFIYGNVLDIMMKVVGLVPGTGIFPGTVCYVTGLITCAIGVSFLFHTYISPEAYELFVKEISARFNIDSRFFEKHFDFVDGLRLRKFFGGKVL